MELNPIAEHIIADLMHLPFHIATPPSLIRTCSVTVSENQIPNLVKLAGR
jgi:hypothetical protein